MIDEENVIVEPRLDPDAWYLVSTSPRPLTAFDLYFAVRCALLDRGVGDDVTVWTRDDETPGAVLVAAYCERTRRYAQVPMSEAGLYRGDVMMMLFVAAQFAKWVEERVVNAPAFATHVHGRGMVR